MIGAAGNMIPTTSMLFSFSITINGELIYWLMFVFFIHITLWEKLNPRTSGDIKVVVVKWVLHSPCLLVPILTFTYLSYMLYNTQLNHPAPVGYSSEDAEPTSCVEMLIYFDLISPFPSSTHSKRRETNVNTDRKSMGHPQPPVDNGLPPTKLVSRCITRIFFISIIKS